MAKVETNKNSIAALYPMTKFILVLCISTLGIALPGIIPKLICFIGLNILAAASGVYKKFITILLSTVGVMMLFMIVMQALFYPGETILGSFWLFSVNLEGILYGLKLGLILFNVGGSFIWFFALTSQKDFVYALEKSGLNPKASYVVLATLQMAPLLNKRSKVIMNAQKSRGVETEGSILTRMKVFIPTIAPLILSTIASTEERALTLEARGFSAATVKTHIYSIEQTDKDRMLVKVFIILTAIILVGRIMLWLF